MANNLRRVGVRVLPSSIVDPDAGQFTPGTTYDPGLSEEAKGLRRGTVGVLGTSLAGLGQVIEPFSEALGGRMIDTARDRILEADERFPASVRTFDDVTFGENFGDYALGKLGEGLPSIGAGLAGGVGGRVLGGLAGLTPRAATYLGGAATALPMESGEQAINLRNDPVAFENTTPVERLGLSLGKGAINAGLEAIPETIALGRVFGSGARIARGVQPAVNRLAGSVVEGAVGEGLTEAAQEGVGQAVQNIANPDAGYDLSQIREAGISGAIPGTVIGGVGGVGQVLHSNLTPSKEEIDSAKKATSDLTTSVLKRARQAIDNPQELGEDLGKMTLSGLDTIAEKAKQAGEYVLDKGDGFAGYAARAKQRLDDAIANNPGLTDDDKLVLKTAAEHVGDLTMDNYEKLNTLLKSKGMDEFSYNAGQAAGTGGRTLFDAAKGLAKTSAEMFKGYVRGITSKGRFSYSAATLTPRDQEMLNLINDTPELSGLKKILDSYEKNDRNVFLKNLAAIQDQGVPQELRAQLDAALKENAGVSLADVFAASRARAESSEKADALTDRIERLANTLAVKPSTTKTEDLFTGVGGEYDLSRGDFMSHVHASRKTDKETKAIRNEYETLREKKGKTLDEELRLAELNDEMNIVALRNDPRNELRSFKQDLTMELENLDDIMANSPTDEDIKYVNTRKERVGELLKNLDEFERRAAERASSERTGTKRGEPAKLADLQVKASQIKPVLRSMSYKSFDELTSGEKGLLSDAFGGLDPLKAHDILTSLHDDSTDISASLDAARPKDEGADAQQANQFFFEDTLDETGGGQTSTTEQLQDLGELLNDSHIQEAISSATFAKAKDRNLPVWLSAEGVDPAKFYDLFKNKVTQDKKTTERPYSDDEKFVKNGRAGVRLSPMSLVEMAQKSEELKNALPAYDDKKSAKYRKGEVFTTVLPQLLTTGFSVDPTKLGLPAGDPIKVKVELDSSMFTTNEKGERALNIPNNMKIGKGTSWADYVGELSKGKGETIFSIKQTIAEAEKVIADKNAKAASRERAITNKARAEKRLATRKANDIVDSLRTTMYGKDQDRSLLDEAIEYYSNDEPTTKGNFFEWKVASGLPSMYQSEIRDSNLVERLEELRDELDDSEDHSPMYGRAEDRHSSTDDIDRNDPNNASDVRKYDQMRAEQRRTIHGGPAVALKEAKGMKAEKLPKGPAEKGTFPGLASEVARQEAAPKKRKPRKTTPKRGANPKEEPNAPEQVAAAVKETLNEKQEAIIKEIQRIFGKRIAVKFSDMMGANGEYSSVNKNAVLAKYEGQTRDEALKTIRDARRKAIKDGQPDRARELEKDEHALMAEDYTLGIITMAANAENIHDADHEVLHAAFDVLLTPDERRAVATAFSRGLVGRKVRQHFKDDPGALAAMEQDGEEAAAYGFQLWVANKDFLNLGPEVQSAFGKVKDFIRSVFGLLSPEQRAQLILNDVYAGRRSRTRPGSAAIVIDKDKSWKQRAGDSMGSVGKVVYDGYNGLMGTTFDRLKETENPALFQIARLGHKPTGEDGSMGYIQKKRAETQARINKLDRALKLWGDEEIKGSLEALVKGEDPGGKQGELVNTVRSYLREMYDYAKEAGVEMGDLGEKYFPTLWDAEKVAENRQAFIDMLETKYAEEMKTVSMTANEIADSIVSEIERGENFESILDQNGSPVAQSSKKRSLGFIQPEDRLAFVNEDPLHTLLHYTDQLVRKAEFSRAYGTNGQRLTELRREAVEKYGATPAEMQLATDYTNAILGNMEVGMSRDLKDIYGGAIAYQNLRLLPLNVLTSLVDPLGVAVRTNSLGEAWEVFKYSVKNTVRQSDIFSDTHEKDAMEMLAEDYGIIEDAGIASNLHNMYESITLRGFSKRVNDALFKYNLLNGWVRTNKIMAMAAGQRFMVRAAQGKFGENSDRYLEELGLTKDDIVTNEKGSLIVRKDDLMARGVSEDRAEEIEAKIRQASIQMVEQSMLNPSAAERPNWANNPYFAPIFHLKQFAFSFNKVIMDRMYHEADFGNYKPAMAVGLYVPGIMTADFIRSGLSNLGGDEPEWKKNWTFGDYLQEGVKRSGIAGPAGVALSDAGQDLQYGGTGIESFAGPTAGQIFDAGKVVAGRKDGYNFFVDALPANAVYDQALAS
jgi:hypothetical protein